MANGPADADEEVAARQARARAAGPEAEWVFGRHAVAALLTAAPGDVRRLLVAEGRRPPDVQALTERAQTAGVRVERVPAAALRRRAKAAGVGGAASVAAERRSSAAADERTLDARLAALTAPFLVALDGVADPRNLGACLRTAEAAGVDAVLLPRRGSAPLSSVAAKAASGALEHLPVIEVANLARRLTWLRKQGVWLVGGVDEGGSHYADIDYRGPLAVLVGGEHRGLRRLVRERCDHLVSIPMAGRVASLNVSVALGVLLFEAQRQRRTNQVAQATSNAPAGCA